MKYQKITKVSKNSQQIDLQTIPNEIYISTKRYIPWKERHTNSELIKKYLFVHDLGDVLKNFKKSKTNPERNKIQVGIIKNELTDLKEEI